MGAKLLMLGICTVTSRANSEVREPGITESQNKLDLNWAVLISSVLLIMSRLQYLYHYSIIDCSSSPLYYSEFPQLVSEENRAGPQFAGLIFTRSLYSRPNYFQIHQNWENLYIGRIMGGELQAE